MKYYITGECDSCSETFPVPVTVRKVSTGGELDVLRLAPTGQIVMGFFEIDDLPATCPECGEPIT